MRRMDIHGMKHGIVIVLAGKTANQDQVESKGRRDEC